MSASPPSPQHHQIHSQNPDIGFAERAISAACAAVVSAIIVNPFDIAKTRLQAQAAGVRNSISPEHQHKAQKNLFEYKHHPHDYGGRYPKLMDGHESLRYKGTLDVFIKVIRQEGFGRLWRGTNASLMLAVPSVGIYLPCYDVLHNWMVETTMQSHPYLTPYTPLVAGSVARTIACLACSPIELARTRMQAFKVAAGGKPSGMWKTLTETLAPKASANNIARFQGFRLLWTGASAQLARDVPFSAICWSTLEPIRKRLLGLADTKVDAASVLWANFLAGFVAGSLAAAATCPFDVAKTLRQVENNHEKVLKTTTRGTLVEVWRIGGVKGLFAGVVPRIGRAGSSVGIVVSFYEVVKYILSRRHEIV